MASLEIHQINVGQGDAILVINRDLDQLRAALERASPNVTVATPLLDWMPLAIRDKVPLAGTVKQALLIDGGDDGYGGDIVAYLERHGVLPAAGAANKVFCPPLSVLVSHFHDDHMAGLRSLFRQRVERDVIDMSSGRPRRTLQVTFPERFRPACVYHTSPNATADPTTERFRALTEDIAAAHGATAAQGQTRVVHIDRGGFLAAGAIPPAGFALSTIDLGTGMSGIPIRLHIIAAAQSVYQPGATPVDVPSVGRNADQNDRSIVLVLEYGSFRYFLGGDIAGNGLAAGGNMGTNQMDTKRARFSTTHADVETPLSAALLTVFPQTTVAVAGQPKHPWAGYCTVLKANHHASSSSVDVHFLATIRPKIAVISSGLKARFHNHPTQQVIDRMSTATTPQWGVPGPPANRTVANTIEQVYVTEVAQTAKGRAFGVDLRNARILGDVVIRPTDDSVNAVQTAAAFGTPLTVQVYGTGEQSELDVPRNEARPCTAGLAGAPDYYPIGPWTHSDVH